jgi:predicted  nucleic acid-binding Zn-ribbon protein
MYSWVLETELCYYEDYQARRQRTCDNCGTLEPYGGNDSEKVCPTCGGKKYSDKELDSEVLYRPVQLSDGTYIHASEAEPLEIPYYKPDIFPVVLQRNVSAVGKFLGNSDVDLIYDQQCTTNRIHQRIIEKLLTGGSFTTLPRDARIRTDNAIGKTIEISDPAKKALIDSRDLTCDIQQELAYLTYVYEEARKLINITDSFQGRNDSTATSKVAKEFAAKQTAGRLESKRQLKSYAYSKLFEIMFKFKLAYTDEPRPIRAHDEQNETVYDEFNRYDFLEKDDAGEWYWIDDFIFSVDTASPLASNREAMWQETRMNLESGAFGNPQALETLILFWSKMEMLHYPGAGETKQYLIEQKNAQEEAAAEQMQAQNAAMSQLEADIDAQARRDAEAAVMGGSPA